jgi:hypothetical protein
MSLTKVTYSMIQGAPVNVLDYGADPTGTSDSTAAINAAIASGQSVYFPRGTYLTTGGHSISYPSNQMFFGEAYDATIIRKSSGTNTIFNIVQFAQCAFENLTIDANNLGGTVFMWRAHYSTMTNVNITNVGGTSYAFHCSGSNLCQFTNVNVFNSYGGYKIDQSTDPLPVNPSYGMLYSAFYHCSADIRSGGESALYFDGSVVGNLNFNDFYIEVAVSNTTKPAIYFGTGSSNILNINFTQMAAEIFGGAQHFIEFSNAVIYNISFNQCSFGISGAMTVPVVKATAVENLEFNGCAFSDLFSAAAIVFALDACYSVIIKNSNLRFQNSFVFIDDNGNNFYISEENNVNRLLGATGKNEWFTANYSSTQNSDILQTRPSGNGQIASLSFSNIKDQHSQSTCGYITIADEGSYDIFGNGGTVAPGTAFCGVITIHGLPTNRDTIAAATANNFATFYAQSNSSASSQAYAAIAVGSNVEVDVLADGVATALATTTDGKLGVQIGGGSEAAKAVRIYNRTGAAISLNVDVKAFK